MTFARHCHYCGDFIPEDRLRKGYGTCKPECQKLDRKGYMAKKLEMRTDRVLNSGKFKKLVRVAVKARTQGVQRTEEGA